MDRTVTISLPESLYEQLVVQARVAARSVDDQIILSLRRGLPIAMEPDLPPAVRAELAAMDELSDDALWTIARAVANDDKIALLDTLTERKRAGTLTPEGQHLLTQLREEADGLALRKAHAYALLQSRRHRLPSLADLRHQSQ
jgi:hypothetical protein